MVVVPKNDPEHKESQPSIYGADSSSCDVDYTSSTTGEFSFNGAGMSVQVEFTNAAADTPMLAA
ncbi:hypothetical protein AB0M12_12155 [Nocardia vinacea]|uniref:hypothetical protein n=1 Tax=Nocardia vinacea TaxID=96468 RepID=UPI0034308D02